jgi:hypothetical protein
MHRDQCTIQADDGALTTEVALGCVRPMHQRRFARQYRVGVLVLLRFVCVFRFTISLLLLRPFLLLLLLLFLPLLSSSFFVSMHFSIFLVSVQFY